MKLSNLDQGELFFYGIPQGAIKYCDSSLYSEYIGTRSLGSCFAFILILKNNSCYFSHVHAGSSNSFLSYLENNLAILSYVIIVEGTAGSKGYGTESDIDLIYKTLPFVKGLDKFSAPVFKPSKYEGIAPNFIETCKYKENFFYFLHFKKSLGNVFYNMKSQRIYHSSDNFKLENEKEYSDLYRENIKGVNINKPLFYMNP